MGLINYNQKETTNMPPTSKEIEKLIDNIDTKIAYFQGLREHATKEISGLLDAKSEMIDTYKGSDND